MTTAAIRRVRRLLWWAHHWLRIRTLIDLYRIERECGWTRRKAIIRAVQWDTWATGRTYSEFREEGWL